MMTLNDDNMLDVAYCSRKEAEYRAKAQATTDPTLKAAYEATAREFAYRIRQLRAKPNADK